MIKVGSKSPPRPKSMFLIVLLSALHAVILATGIVAIVFVLAATVRHMSVGDLYTELFPRYRGGPAPERLPAGVYLVFFAYVLSAVELALSFRQRMNS